MKKPSLKGMQNTKYLGHFAQDKFIQAGHNDSGKATIKPTRNTDRAYARFEKAHKMSVIYGDESDQENYWLQKAHADAGTGKEYLDDKAKRRADKKSFKEDMD